MPVLDTDIDMEKDYSTFRVMVFRSNGARWRFALCVLEVVLKYSFISQMQNVLSTSAAKCSPVALD